MMRETMQEMVRECQDTITTTLAEFDGASFREDVWERDGGGGGRTRVLQDGQHFEKAGVNVSAVHGTPPPSFADVARGRGVKIPEGDLEFFATGISMVLHPHNPMAPTMHANYRYFELVDGTGQIATWWFGGGTDLTPCYVFDDDAIHFHQAQKDACDRHHPEYYPKFKKWCDEYFHLPHRDEARGIGGIFFDNLNDRAPEEIFAFSSDCAASILPAVMPIYERRVEMPFDIRHKRWQQVRRGRYVEFNLVYDRGTTFGLKIGGRTESILMSLPLSARWEYRHEPAPGTPEAETVAVLREPRDWLTDPRS